MQLLTAPASMVHRLWVDFLLTTYALLRNWLKQVEASVRKGTKCQA